MVSTCAHTGTVGAFARFCRYMEYAVVFGLAIPPILPMLAIVLAVQSAVFHFSKEHLNVAVVNDHRPPLQYLWFSIFMGYLLIVWFFVDNDMHGAGLAVLGPPTLVLYMALWDQVRSSASPVPPTVIEDGTLLPAGGDL